MACNLKSRLAFTLIELLVVISIIALLIGILLPALGAARQVARISQSASNQRQIGIAMAAYQADNKEYFPLWQQSSGGSPVDGTPIWYWTTRLAVDNYIPGLNVYFDPTFVDANSSFLELPPVTKDNMDDRNYNRIHYGYNFVHVGGNYHQLGRSGIDAQNVQANPRNALPDSIPARMIDMEDPTSVLVTTGVIDYLNQAESGFDPTKRNGAHVVIDIPFGSVANAGVPHARYNNATQTNWADGHVSQIVMPFTEDEQARDQASGGSTLGDRMYKADAFGDVRNFGKISFRTGTGLDAANGGNYFDLRSSKPLAQ